MQSFYITNKDDIKKSITIEEYGNKFIMMVSDDAGSYSYFPENDKPREYNTALDAFSEISKLWNFSNAIKIETTNEFVKVEELREMFKGIRIEHI